MCRLNEASDARCGGYPIGPDRYAPARRVYSTYGISLLPEDAPTSTYVCYSHLTPKTDAVAAAATCARHSHCFAMAALALSIIAAFIAASSSRSLFICPAARSTDEPGCDERGVDVLPSVPSLSGW